MIKTNHTYLKECAEFSYRLATLMRRVKIPVTSSHLQKAYNQHVTQMDDIVSEHTVAKWLTGRDMPTVDRMRVLAVLLQERIDVLAFGTDSVLYSEKLSFPETTLISRYRSLSDFSKRVVSGMLDTVAEIDSDKATTP